MPYWIEVMVVGYFTQFKSTPVLAELFESTEFSFVISLEGMTDCEAWIADNAMSKTLDVQSSLRSSLEGTDYEWAALSCGQ